MSIIHLPEAGLTANTMRTELWADGKKLGSGAYRTPVRSEDGKTLFFCYEIEGNGLGRSLAGNTLTLRADGVAVQRSTPGCSGLAGTPVDLSPMASWDVPDLPGVWLFGDPPGLDEAQWSAWLESGRVESERRVKEALEANPPPETLNLPNPAFPQYAVWGAVTTEDGLCLAITQGRYERGDEVCAGVEVRALVDSRTGTCYEPWSWTDLELSNGVGLTLVGLRRDCPLTAADFSYLTLETAYEVDRILSPEPFSIPFEGRAGAVAAAALDETVSLDGAAVRVTGLKLSALRVIATFDGDAVFDLFHIDPERYAGDPRFHTGPSPRITLDDGTVLETELHGYLSDEEHPAQLQFYVEDQTGSRVFLDVERVASVSLGDLVVPMGGESEP